jgi:hypothetical protein
MEMCRGLECSISILLEGKKLSSTTASRRPQKFAKLLKKLK